MTSLTKQKKTLLTDIHHSFKFQKKLRDERLDEIAKKKSMVEKERKMKKKSIWKDNETCEKSLLKELGKKKPVSFARLKMFANCKMLFTRTSKSP